MEYSDQVKYKIKQIIPNLQKKKQILTQKKERPEGLS